MNKRSFSLISSILLSLCLALVAFGQETTGGLQGTVKDPNGAVVPGAVLTIKGESVGYSRTITADQNGFYRVEQMPPGDYTVSVTSSGFSMKPMAVRVALGKTTETDLQVSVSGATATVDVTGTDGQIVADPTDSTVQSNIGSKLIDQVPKGVSFDSLLRLDPAVRSEPLGGGFQVDGASGAENNFTIDGQEVNNFRHGTLNSANAVPNQVVSEVQVRTSGFEAEFGGASGAVVSVVTKSGSNDWHGEFGTQFTISNFNGGNRPNYLQYRGTGAFAGQPFVYNYTDNNDTYTNFFPTANLSGPIVKDRVWFFSSYSPQIFETQRTVNYFNQTVTGNQISFTPSVPTNANNQFLLPTEDYSARTKYEYALFKLDAQISNSLRFMGSFLWNPEILQGGLSCGAFCVGSRPNVFFGGNQYTGREATRRQGGRVNSNNTTLQAVWSPTSKFFMNFRYGHNFLNDKPASYGVFAQTSFLCSSSGNPNAYASGCTPSFRNIPSASNFLTERNVSKRDVWDVDATYLVNNFGGRHQFKGGYERGQVQSDVAESYIGGLTTLYYGLPITALLGASYTPTPGNFGSGILQEYGELAKGKNSWDSLYVQDNWTIGGRLTLNLGIRTERENLPAYNTAGGVGQAFSFGFGDKIMPRLGFALDLTGSGKTKVFGSYGTFMDRLRFELPIGSFGGAYYRYNYFELLGANQNYASFTIPRITGTFGNPVGGACPINNPAVTLIRCQLDFRIPSNLPESTYTALGIPRGGIDPDLKPFTQREITVGMEHQLNRTMLIRARYSHKNVIHAIEDMANLSNDFGESYIIGNPGEGLALQLRNQVGYVKQDQAPAIRKYDGLEIVFDRGLANNFFFNASYTFSRLFGNYSGLASSDEKGRSDPGVNRFFDYPINGFTAAGTPDAGRLPTDRPHVFKSYGGYVFDWFGRRNHSTTISYFTTVTSGTPVTTFVDVESSFIPLTRRGDLGRTETFTQTDLTVSHKYRFGRDNKYALGLDLNVTNLFDESNVIDVQNKIDATGIHCGDINAAFTATQCMNYILTNGIVSNVQSFLAATPTARTATYGLPAAYQGPRSVRFGMRFLF